MKLCITVGLLAAVFAVTAQAFLFGNAGNGGQFGSFDGVFANDQHSRSLGIKNQALGEEQTKINSGKRGQEKLRAAQNAGARGKAALKKGEDVKVFGDTLFKGEDYHNGGKANSVNLGIKSDGGHHKKLIIGDQNYKNDQIKFDESNALKDSQGARMFFEDNAGVQGTSNLFDQQQAEVFDNAGLQAAGANEEVLGIGAKQLKKNQGEVVARDAFGREFGSNTDIGGDVFGGFFFRKRK